MSIPYIRACSGKYPIIYIISQAYLVNTSCYTSLHSYMSLVRIRYHCDIQHELSDVNQQCLVVALIRFLLFFLAFFLCRGRSVIRGYFYFTDFRVVAAEYVHHARQMMSRHFLHFTLSLEHLFLVEVLE